MDVKKQKAFNEKMGKRQKMSKGGMIKKIGDRHYFADGGVSLNDPTTLTGPSNLSVNQNAVNPSKGIGALGSVLGLNDNFKAGAADTQQGTNAAQLNQAYQQNQTGLNLQEGQATALNPQISSAVSNQNALANQLLGMSQGQGPNPAQAQLNQNTAANVANTAALMAGQRGASANPGLIARQIGQRGAATQQQAVGQEATLAAQQQIAAQNQLANLAASQIGQSGVATQNLNTAQQGEQGILQNANSAFNNNQVGMQSNINNVNAATAAANQQMNGTLFGGVMQGASSALAPFIGSGGGGALSGIASAFMAKGGNVTSGPHKSHVANFLMSEGGKVPAMVSPGEIYLNPDEVKKVVHEGANPLKMGKKFLGKPKVKGDSEKNDTIPADLEEGGVVIPRHVMNKKDADKASLFVHRAVHMKKPGGK